VQLLAIITFDREPEWNLFCLISKVQSDKRICGRVRVVTGEEQNAPAKITVVIVEEVIFAVPRMGQSGANLEQVSDESDYPSAGVVVKVLPVDDAEEAGPAYAAGRDLAVLAQLLTLPEQGDSLGHKHPDEVGLELVPFTTVTLLEERVAAVVGIGFAEIADESVVVVVLDKLQGRFEEAVAVNGNFGRPVFRAVGEAELGQRAVLNGGHLLGGGYGLVLPRAGAVCLLEYVPDRLQLLGTLDETNRINGVFEALIFPIAGDCL